jgi:hypothetical protein
MLRRWVELGRIAPEVFENKAAWPQQMREEWGDDEGQAAASEHHTRLMSGYARLREELDAFRPDIVLIWGDDQYENFKRDCIPAFCVGIFDSVTSRPYGGGAVPFATKENVWGLPPDAELEVRCHYEGAAELTKHMIASSFDVAYSRTVRHTAGLAHSFNNTVMYLDYDRKGFPYPVIPFHVNCYGNQLIKTSASAVGEGANEISPPAPTPSRCFELGREVARFFAASPWRVALVASSSWSHASLTPKHGRLYPDLEADRLRLAELKSGGYRQWGAMSPVAIENAGQHEILNWVCLAGAMTQLGHELSHADLVESWIFNSSKCFASFREAQTR